MKIDVSHTDEGLVVALGGIIKKPDAKELADEIENLARSKPQKVAFDFSGVAAVAFDAVPPVVSALERARLGKSNVSAFGCNEVVAKVLRGSGFDRVAGISA